jgi:hypothetical protein
MIAKEKTADFRLDDVTLAELMVVCGNTEKEYI